jgi:hypothetical protein
MSAVKMIVFARFQAAFCRKSRKAVNISNRASSAMEGSLAGKSSGDAIASRAQIPAVSGGLETLKSSRNRSKPPQKEDFAERAAVRRRLAAVR